VRHSPGSISRGGRLFTTGTKSSNPSSSCGESLANLASLIKEPLAGLGADAEAEPAARQDVETGSLFGDYALTENT
jgi:hypothetical protein